MKNNRITMGKRKAMMEEEVMEWIYSRYNNPKEEFLISPFDFHIEPAEYDFEIEDWERRQSYANG